MKIFNPGINLTTVMFACNRCGAVWSATPDFNYDYDFLKDHYKQMFAWRDTHPIENKYYRRSNSGKTFMCECPNCNKTAKTPALLHSAYVNYGKELD